MNFRIAFLICSSLRLGSVQDGDVVRGLFIFWLSTQNLISSCAMPVDNYLNFQDADGIYTSVVSLEKSVCAFVLFKINICLKGAVSKRAFS